MTGVRWKGNRSSMRGPHPLRYLSNAQAQPPPLAEQKKKRLTGRIRRPHQPDNTAQIHPRHIPSPSPDEPELNAPNVPYTTSTPDTHDNVHKTDLAPSPPGRGHAYVGSGPVDMRTTHGRELCGFYNALSRAEGRCMSSVGTSYGL